MLRQGLAEHGSAPHYLVAGGPGGGFAVGLAEWGDGRFVGALLLGMTWFWLVCLVLLVGGELNQILAARAGVIGDNKRWSTQLLAARDALRDRRDEPEP